MNGVTEIRRALRGALLASMASASLILALPAQAITGTWSGELIGSNGERVNVSYGFSPRGALIVQLPSQQGYRAIELTHAGQTDSWFAPNGRPASGRVLALDAGPSHFSADIRMTSGGQNMPGVLAQESIALQLRFVQQGEQLKAEVWMRREVSLTGEHFGPRPPQVESVVHRGRLTRAW